VNKTAFVGVFLHQLD